MGKIEHYGNWYVEENGYLYYKDQMKPVEIMYDLDEKRLKEQDWILHMLEKRWCNMNDFIPAYLHACKNAGIQILTIKTYY